MKRQPQVGPGRAQVSIVVERTSILGLSCTHGNAGPNAGPEDQRGCCAHEGEGTHEGGSQNCSHDTRDDAKIGLFHPTGITKPAPDEFSRLDVPEDAYRSGDSNRNEFESKHVPALKKVPAGHDPVGDLLFHLPYGAGHPGVSVSDAFNLARSLAKGKGPGLSCKGPSGRNLRRFAPERWKWLQPLPPPSPSSTREGRK